MSEKTKYFNTCSSSRCSKKRECLRARLYKKDDEFQLSNREVVSCELNKTLFRTAKMRR